MLPSHSGESGGLAFHIGWPFLGLVSKTHTSLWRGKGFVPEDAVLKALWDRRAFPIRTAEAAGLLTDCIMLPKPYGYPSSLCGERRSFRRDRSARANGVRSRMRSTSLHVDCQRASHCRSRSVHGNASHRCAAGSVLLRWSGEFWLLSCWP